jgi:CheY-like chemotaxis protein
MAKIMLVEDDNNLREIYEARLLAEGYEIVSAKDGEEALAMAVKEKPDLIISDVMMPKISGFDMLDILRSTPETKNTKVIMMTALSQAEDKTRADKLGADRYLVKSQVTLEDVAKVARDVLNGESAPVPAPVDPAPVAEVPVTDSPVTPAPAPVEPPAPADPATDVPAEPPVVPEPVEPATPVEPTSPTPDPVPAADPVVDPAVAQSAADEAAAVKEQIDTFVAEVPVEQPAATTEEPTETPKEADPGAKAAELAEAVNSIMKKDSTPTEAEVAPVSENNDSTSKRIIQPLSDPTSAPDLNELLKKEEAKEAEAAAPSEAPAAPDAPAPEDPTTDQKPTDGPDPHSIAL